MVIIKQVVKNKNKKQEVQDGIYESKFPHERAKKIIKNMRESI